MFFMIDSQSFATGIPATDGEAQPADCDNDTLDTTSGTANLRADFEANRIDLRWYDNNTMLNVSSTSSDKCIYDTTIDLPTNPTKTGYTFKGWKVRPEYDFSTLTTGTNGAHRYGRGIDDTTDTDYCMHGTGSAGSTTIDCSNSNLSDLNRREWKTIFSWGTIYGMSICSSSVGQSRTSGTPNESSSGQYCWCKSTGYVPNNSATKYKPNVAPVYVFTENVFSTEHECLLWCSTNCAFMADNDSVFRTAIFGASGS